MFAAKIRFIIKLIPAIILLLAVIGVVSEIEAHVGGGWGLVLGIIAAACFGVGTLGLYWLVVGWLNYRYLKRDLTHPKLSLEDGQICAISGVTRTDDVPLISPFSQQLCAAYDFSVSYNSVRREHTSSTRVIVAQGFHLLPTRIENQQFSVTLGALPDVSEDLTDSSTKPLPKPAYDYLTSLITVASSAGQMEREAALIEARRRIDNEVRQDYCMVASLDSSSQYTVVENRVPINSSVCVVGTFNQSKNAMTGENQRFGPNLMLYNGSAKEVLAREGKELRWFAKGTFGLLTAFAAIVAFVVVRI